MKRSFSSTTMRWIVVYFLFLGAAGCAPSSQEDFRCEGEAEAKAIVAELHRIHSTEELRSSMPRLRKQFLKLADVIIAARAYLAKHPDEGICSPGFASDEIFAELSRIYEIPKGRELIESAQSSAIERLRKGGISTGCEKSS